MPMQETARGRRSDARVAARIPVLAWILTIGAAVALTALLVALVVQLWGRVSPLDALALADQLRKLLGADNASRAVKLCGALDPRSPERQLTLFMLALERPGASVSVEGAADYRAAPPVERFDDVARAATEQEVRRLARAVWRDAVAVVAFGVLAAGAGAVGWLTATGDLRTVVTALGVAGALGMAFGLSRASKMSSGTRALGEAMLPLLRPIEEMTADRRAAASAAREMLAAPVVNTGRTKLIGLILGTAVCGGTLGAFALSLAPLEQAPRSLPETLGARVTRTAGNAPPVGRGSVCTTAIAPAEGTFNCRIEVSCGGTGLYGTTPSMGYAHCSWDGAVALSALDEHDDDGDPALRLDRGARSVEVRTESWTVTLELVIDGPDAGG